MNLCGQAWVDVVATRVRIAFRNDKSAARLREGFSAYPLSLLPLSCLVHICLVRKCVERVWAGPYLVSGWCVGHVADWVKRAEGQVQTRLKVLQPKGRRGR